MSENNRPVGRKKTYGTGSSGVHKEGPGLGTGPVGNSNGYSGRTGGGPHSGHPQSSHGGGTRGTMRSSGGGGGLGKLIIIALVLLLGGGGGLSSFLGGGSSSSTQQSSYSQQSQQSSYTQQTQSSSVSSPSQHASSSGSSDLTTLISNMSGTHTTSETFTDSTGKLDEEVAEGARDKYTSILGNKKDTVTVMLYMCGADLESQSGMATRDLQEIAAASTDKINFIVYTGGASKWNNKVISSSVNQIYQVTGGGLKRLESDMGKGVMTDPTTLTSFIKYCAKNFPANRNELILWDHGGGSVTGYGYDEKHSQAGSMSLDEISSALSAGGVKFDFVGFDACLMATLENGLMLSDYADYLIASEETEPGYGWYYTNWVNKINSNTSVSTLELGKLIVDDFVSTSAKSCPGQKTTLSVVDLAELDATVPSELKSFSQSISKLISNSEYKTVSAARNSTREFATTSPIDQVDLTDLAEKLGNEEGEALAEAIRGAVKYNKTSSNMNNAYGVSIYFPYKKVSLINNAVQTYSAIGMDDDYSKCIQDFANMGQAGQYAAGGSSTATPMYSLFGDYTGYGSSYSGYGSGSYSSGSSSSGSYSYGGSYDSTEMLEELLGAFLSGSTGYSTGRSISSDETAQYAEYISENHIDTDNFTWNKDADGIYTMHLPEDQWSLVNDLTCNMFYDDGDGYIDLGLDNVFEFTDDGDLIGNSDGTWLSINGDIVAYYYMDSTYDGDNYTITGRVPALLNGQRVNLLIVFDNEHEDGYIAGAMTDYKDGQTETLPKSLTELNTGDTLRYLCDYYSYDGTYQDSYYLGSETTVKDQMLIRNDSVGGPIKVTYKFTDIYGQEYWTPSISQE